MSAPQIDLFPEPLAHGFSDEEWAVAGPIHDVVAEITDKGRWASVREIADRTKVKRPTAWLERMRHLGLRPSDHFGCFCGWTKLGPTGDLRLKMTLDDWFTMDGLDEAR